MTLMVEGALRRVKFEGGVFSTEDPVLQDALEQVHTFGRVIKLAGDRNAIRKDKPAEGPDPRAEEAPKPAKKGKGGNRKKTSETKAITAFMEKEVNA